MNILIIGSGAREHAIANAFRRSEHFPVLYCVGATLNPGIRQLVDDYWVGDVADHDTILEKADQWGIDFVIIGPEAPLEDGLADALWAADVPVVGPKKALARIETSKAFARDLLKKYEIPGSPDYQVCDTLAEAKKCLKKLGDGKYVIKADGLMGGKGVFVAGDHLHSLDEAYRCCEALFLTSKSIVIEERLIGQEFSLLSFCDGKTLAPMPIVQDHKRAFVNDEGPNTGGMGTYSDANHRLPFLTEKDVVDAEAMNVSVLKALTEECKERYVGILYGSFIATAKGVQLIEYNARFGDPEVMNVLPILETDLVEICEAMIAGQLNKVSVQFARRATVCKYLVPNGYPDASEKNTLIDVSAVEEREQLYLGGVEEKGDQLYTTGSRAIAVVGVAGTISDAEAIAEMEVNRVKGQLFHRPDIGTDALIEERIEHMQTLRCYV